MNASASAVRRIWRTVAVAGLAFGARDARAQISVSGSPAAMKVTMAVAGSAPDAVTNSSTTYSISSKPSGNSHWAVTAALNTPMPTGVTLQVALATSSGSSAGTVTLGTTAQTVVSTISRAMLAQSITYTLSATAAAGVVPLQTRQVTLTQISTP